jgi:hypothetical protein
MKTNGCPRAPLCPLAQSTIAFPSSSSCLKKEREKKAKMKGKLGIDFALLLYIPRVGESGITDFLELVCPRSNYFDNQVWPLP